MNKILKVGIIGYGVVGKRRRKYIDLNPQLRTCFISDIALIDHYNQSEGVKYFKNYKDLFKNNVDVIFVSLPNYLAANVVIIALEHGCNVFCEKPPSRTVEELKVVVECSIKRPHLKLKYGFNHRYHDSVKKATDIINSNLYGDVVSFRGIYGKSSIIPFGTGWRSEKKYSGGGILLDQGIHMLDLIQYFSGQYNEIHSFISNEYWNHNVEDNAFVLMRNKAGQIAILHSTATQWQHRFRLEIILKEGLLELSGILSGSKSYGAETLKVIERLDGQSSGAQEEKVYNFLEDNSWRDEIDEFADCIINDKPVKNGTSIEALNVMEMISKIYQADKNWWKFFK